VLKYKHYKLRKRILERRREMGDKITLQVDERDVHGKKVKTLRAKGLTPGVVYGPDMEPMNIQIAEGELKKVVAAAGKHTPVHLTGKKRRIAMIKDVDIDPVRNAIQHVAFHAVRANEPVTTDVPIHLVGMGESVAEKNGLIILQTLDRIEVKALPMELPESIEVSVLEMAEEGEKLTLAAAKLSEGVEFVEHEDQRHADDEEDEDRHRVIDQVVATVWEPGALQAANEASAGDAEDESEVESEHGEEDATANDEASTEKEK
jgi:large subunit ribosomal protein L25